MSEPIRILVADDHLIIRQGLRLILETQEGFEMVGAELGDQGRAGRQVGMVAGQERRNEQG